MNNILFFVLFLVIIIIALYFINYRKKQHFTSEEIDYSVENELIWNCGKDENGDNVITDPPPPIKTIPPDRTNFFGFREVGNSYYEIYQHINHGGYLYVTNNFKNIFKNENHLIRAYRGRK